MSVWSDPAHLAHVTAVWGAGGPHPSPGFYRRDRRETQRGQRSDPRFDPGPDDPMFRWVRDPRVLGLVGLVLAPMRVGPRRCGRARHRKLSLDSGADRLYVHDVERMAADMLGRPPSTPAVSGPADP